MSVIPSNTSHYHIKHRMVPLICQALTKSPTDEQVWLEGLSLLANPKLRTAMSITSSIWLPLLMKGLELNRGKKVIVSALTLLAEVSETLEPMKSCLVKPLRALGRDKEICEVEELDLACGKLAIVVTTEGKKEIGKRNTSARPPSQLTTPIPEPPTEPRDHPLLAEILNRNLPPKTRSVRQAWTHTLLLPAQDNSKIWLQNLFHATLEASAVPELMITSRLGPAIHEELFQTAFLKCYLQLDGDPPFMNAVHEVMAKILSNPAINRDIQLHFLDLIAFFNKDGRTFPDPVLDAAKHCALNHFNGDLNEPMPAIALWYAEQETGDNMSAANLASLVEVNIRVGSAGYDSAWSSLLWRRDTYDVQPNPMWIVHLSHWDEALEEQDREDRGGPAQTFASIHTRMICYHALGQFERGYNLAQSLFEGLNDHERRKLAHWATAAAWHMDDFDTMADYLAFHPKGTSKSLYKAIIDVHHGHYQSAFQHISKAQALSYDELQSVSYGQGMALKTLAKTEMLVELREVIQYRSQPEMQPHILSVWRSRFKRSHADPNSWLKRLRIWTLACPIQTTEVKTCYIECAKLCERLGLHEAAATIIHEVKPDISPPGCKVEYTSLRFRWDDAIERRDEVAMQRALDDLQVHTRGYLATFGVTMEQIEAEGLGLQPLRAGNIVGTQDGQIMSRRFCRLAMWTAKVQGQDWISDPDSQVFRYFSITSKLDDRWFNAGDRLSEAAIQIFEAGGYDRQDKIAVTYYVVPALRGLFLAVRVRETPEKQIKSLLRLITIWFRYGEHESVLSVVRSQLAQTPTSAWLMAIPQLIARLGTRDQALQGVLLDLLKSIASHYPHAMIWPLLTATQTRKVEHQQGAGVIMRHIDAMADGTRLVTQAEMVGGELIRVALSLKEKWRNILDRCIPRQDLMEVPWHEFPAMWEDEASYLSAPETGDEELFIQQYGDQLKHIYANLQRYRSNRQVGLINTCYQDIYNVFVEVDADLKSWQLPGSQLQLASTAPRLLSLRDCILTVPGQYDPSEKLDNQAFIDSFQPTVAILPSKMIPRKLVIRSYTDDFTFLLKGNEDLRGDERIMQLFTLINTLLNHESDAFSRNLHMLPYSVIPLSPSAGLLSWVPNTQTLQQMIRDHREKTKNRKLEYKELAAILGYDPATYVPPERFDAAAEMGKYDLLPAEQKLERLKYCLAQTNQSDLKNVLWSRSPSAEIWLRRRTNFTRTIGVGSFVGHVIGLGDRHGGNILVDQLTWSAVHIDFGDLFGITQERDLMPEKVPFRLTRMMTNAFELAGSRGHEIPGSRGNFKQASILTMTVLRNSRSTLLAMLEAFLYDPLLSWTATTPYSEANTDLTVERTSLASLKPTKKPAPNRHIPQSVAPVRSHALGDSDFFSRIENSLMGGYTDTDSYMAKVSGAGMTNTKALQVLSQIERKLAGYNKGSEQSLPVKKQVQELIEEATDLRNLSQGYVLGWMPHW